METYDVDKIEGFNWYYKDFFSWKYIHDNKVSQRYVYQGVNKKDPKNSVILKKIKVNNNYNKILKEIYFIVCFQKNKYSIKLIDFFLSDDYNNIFIILNDEGINLQSLIEYTQIKNNVYDNDLIKKTIFQIIYQLYIFHKNNLVHNDIKPSNIVISKKVKIIDFGSMDIIGDKSFGTFSYRSPENLVKNRGSEKNDMWAVGVIMIELFKKQISDNKNVKDRISLIKKILSKYKIIMNNNEININDNNIFEIIMKNLINNESFNFQEELKKIDKIQDPDAFDLLKNLLRINPKERFSAEEALNSKYLSEYKNEIEQYETLYKIKDYEELLSIGCNKNDFINNIGLIHQKFDGLEFEK